MQHRAVQGLPFVDYVLVDGNRCPSDLIVKSESIVKGDRKSFSISAASILAKVIRDDLLVSLDKFSLADPILINTDGTIIGGHQRYYILKNQISKQLVIVYSKSGKIY